jgi:hypothetical protein
VGAAYARPAGSAAARSHRPPDVIYIGAVVGVLAGLAVLAFTLLGPAVVFVAGCLGLFGAALTRRVPPPGCPALPAPQAQGDRVRGLVGAPYYISAFVRNNAREKPDPRIQIQIQRTVDDAREYSMRLQ